MISLKCVIYKTPSKTDILGKEIRFVVTRGRGMGQRKLEEVVQRYRLTVIGKIRLGLHCNVQCNDCSYHHSVIHRKVVERVDSEFTSQGKKYFTFSFFVFL